MRHTIFTPGEWDYTVGTIMTPTGDEPTATVFPVGQEDDYCVCYIRDEGGVDGLGKSRVEANARLISKAPTMFDLLNEVKEDYFNRGKRPFKEVIGDICEIIEDVIGDETAN